nr:MAG TPA: hypothetical protein [Caudoviricetes sp.]
MLKFFATKQLLNFRKPWGLCCKRRSPFSIWI